MELISWTNSVKYTLKNITSVVLEILISTNDLFRVKLSLHLPQTPNVFLLDSDASLYGVYNIPMVKVKWYQFLIFVLGSIVMDGVWNDVNQRIKDHIYFDLYFHPTDIELIKNNFSLEKTRNKTIADLFVCQQNQKI